MTLKRLYDTKIIRHVKIKGTANPFDPAWDHYFAKRETYNMLQKFEGRKSLLYIWEKQKRICPLCGTPIDKEIPWAVSEKTVDGKVERTLVHDRCRRRADQLKRRES